MQFIYAKAVRRLLLGFCCFMVLVSLASCTYLESEQTKLDKAQKLYQKNKFSQVIIRTKSILQSDPGSCEARILLGKSQFAEFGLDDAVDSMHKAIDNGCKGPAAYLSLIKIYLYRNQLKNALMLFKSQKLLNTKKTPAFLLLKGDMFFLQQNKLLAKRAYAKYYSVTHNDAEKCLSDLKLKFLDKKYGEVVKGLGLCDKKYSGEQKYNLEESRYLYAISLVKDNKTTEAIKILQSAVNIPLDPKNPFLKIRASILLLHLYLERNEIDKAAMLADKVSRYVATPDVYFAKGRRYQAENRTDLAEKLYLSSLKLDSRYRPSLLALANMKYEEGNIEQARYYTRQADAQAGSKIFTQALDDRLAIKNLEDRNFDAVINALPKDKSVRSQYLLALAYAGKGETEKTWGVFTKIKKHLNSKAKSDLLEARLDIALGNRNKAEKILKKYSGHGNPEAVAELTQLYIAQYKYSAAEFMLTNILQKYPDNRNTEMLLVDLYVKTNQKQKLFKALDAFIKANPGNRGVKVFRAKMYYRYAQYQDAIRQCDALLSNDPALFLAYALKAHAYGKLNNYQAAEQTYSALLKTGLNNDYAYFMLALLSESQSRLDDALNYINKSLKVNSRDIRAIYAKIGILDKLGKKNELMKFANSSAQSFQADSKGYLILGYAFKVLNKNKAAYENYKKGIEAGAVNLNTALIVFRLSKDLNGSKTAVRELDKYLKSKSGNRDLYLAANYFMKNKQYPLATKYYKMLVGRDQRAAIAFNNLAWLRLHAGDIHEALNYAERASALEPNMPAIMDTLGQVLLEKGEYNKAGQFLMRAHSILKNNPMITYHLAQYYYYTKQFYESRKLLINVTNKSFPEQQAAMSLLRKMRH